MLLGVNSSNSRDCAGAHCCGQSSEYFKVLRMAWEVLPGPHFINLSELLKIVIDEAKQSKAHYKTHGCRLK